VEHQKVILTSTLNISKLSTLSTLATTFVMAFTVLTSLCFFCSFSRLEVMVGVFWLPYDMFLGPSWKQFSIYPICKTSFDKNNSL